MNQEGRKMKFAICNEIFEGWEIEKVFKSARQIGYEGVEIAPLTLADSVVEISQARRADIRRSAERANIEVVGLHWLLVKPEGLYINHPNDSIRLRTKEYFIELIEFCADLGGTVMVIGSPKQRNVLENDAYEAAFRRTVEVMKECAEVAGERGVTLCIEPLSSTETNFITTAEEAIKLINAVRHPNFQLILDVKAMSGESRPPDKIIKSSAKYLRHIHANDASRKGPGLGETDFYPIFKALRRIEYRGFVSVEAFDYEPDPVTVAEKSLGYMLRKLKEVDSA